MKRQLLLFAFIVMAALTCHAQGEYTITGTGQGKNGAYFVKITAVIKKVKDAKDILLRDAVHGVLFRGFMNDTDGGTNQKPLVTDPNVEQTKAEFFNAFFNEKKYERYASMTPSSLSSVKVKKGYEVSALFLVDKESLQHYLEESGIIKGFSNLW